MSEAILDPRYWKRRLREAEARQELWKAVFICDKQRWLDIADKHRQILAQHIQPIDSVLDCGCGYGRLPELLPPVDRRKYLGIDLSPEFIDLARIRNPTYSFAVADMRDLHWLRPPHADERYDWAVMISIRPMIIRHFGQGVWDGMESEIRAVAKKLLFLEYDTIDDGEVA